MNKWYVFHFVLCICKLHSCLKSSFQYIGYSYSHFTTYKVLLMHDLFSFNSWKTMIYIYIYIFAYVRVLKSSWTKKIWKLYLAMIVKGKDLLLMVVLIFFEGINLSWNRNDEFGYLWKFETYVDVCLWKFEW